MPVFFVYFIAVYIARVAKGAHGGPCGPGLCDKNIPTSSLDEISSILEEESLPSEHDDFDSNGRDEEQEEGGSFENFLDGEEQLSQDDVESSLLGRSSSGHGEGSMDGASGTWDDEDEYFEDEEMAEEAQYNRDGRRNRCRRPYATREELEAARWERFTASRKRKADGTMKKNRSKA